jgi:hypothetical protein
MPLLRLAALARLSGATNFVFDGADFVFDEPEAQALIPKTKSPITMKNNLLVPAIFLQPLPP